MMRQGKLEKVSGSSPLSHQEEDESHISGDSKTNKYRSDYDDAFFQRSQESMVYVMPSDSNEYNNHPSTKNAGTRWQEEETEALVQIWRDKICQSRWWKQSKGVRVNKEMWEEISQLLLKRDVYRTSNQCQIRMKNLLQFYRQTLDSRKSEKSWDDLPSYFEIVDKIMTRKEDSNTPNEQVEQNVNNSNEDVNDSHLQVHDENSELLRFDTNTSELSPASQPGSENRKLGKRKYTGYISAFDHQKPSSSSSPSNKTHNNYNNHHQNPPHHQHHQSNFPYYTMTSAVSGSKRYSSLHLNPTDEDRKHEQMFPSPHSYCEGSCCQKRHLDNFVDGERKHEETQRDNKESSVTTSDNAFHHQQRNYHRIHYNSSHQASQCSNQLDQNMSQSEFRVESNGSSAKHFHQLPISFFDVHHKQMETLIEIERKRLKVEEERLREDQEANRRNGAFLMEAVKILAETFRKGTTDEKKHEQSKDNETTE